MSIHMCECECDKEVQDQTRVQRKAAQPVRVEIIHACLHRHAVETDGRVRTSLWLSSFIARWHSKPRQYRSWFQGQGCLHVHVLYRNAMVNTCKEYL